MENQIGIYDHATGENIVREMTAEEKQQREEEVNAYKAKEAQRLADIATAETDKAALLAKLGITADEAKLLLS